MPLSTERWNRYPENRLNLIGDLPARQWFSYINARIARDFCVALVVAGAVGTAFGLGVMTGLLYVTKYLVEIFPGK